jgi:hypothetical protein
VLRESVARTLRVADSVDQAMRMIEACFPPATAAAGD